MNTEKVLKGLELIIAGIKEELVAESVTPIKSEVVSKEAIPEKKLAEPAVVAEKATDSIYDAMGYNEIKKIAKERWISSVGLREDVIQRLIAADTSPAPSVKEPEPVKAVEKPVPAPVAPPATPAPKSAKILEPISTPKKTTQELAEEATKDMNDTEIKEFLASIGVKASGKRQSLIAKVVEAVEAGKASFEDDTADTTEEADEEETEDYVITLFKENNASETKLTKKRAGAIDKYLKNIPEVSDEEVRVFLNLDEDKEIGTEDYDNYHNTKLLMIDDDGVSHEDGDPYEVNGDNYCCGETLEYVEETSSFKCAVCGNEYEA